MIATIASAVAAFCAMVTVWQTISYRREERRRALADALITIVSAGQESDPGAGARLEEGLRQIERVSALWLLGLGPEVTETTTKLMDPALRQDHPKAFRLATKAWDELQKKHTRTKPWRRWQIGG